jgi:hypothetical protein
MALYQSTLELKETMLGGSFKVEYAPIVADHTAAVWVEVGYCDNPGFTEEITPLDGSPSNGAKPDINTGIAAQKVALTYELWSLDPTNVIALRGGIDKLVTDVNGVRSVFTGGGSTQIPIMMRYTNRWVDVATAADVSQYTTPALTLGDPIYRDTSFVFFKTNTTAGMAVTGKSDDEADKAQRFPMAMESIEDTDRDVLEQLFVTEYNVALITP